LRRKQQVLHRVVKVTPENLEAWHTNPLQNSDPLTFVDNGVSLLEHIYADWMDGIVRYASFDEYVQLLTPRVLIASAYNTSQYGRRKYLKITLSSATQSRVSDFVLHTEVSFSATYRMIVCLCLLPYDTGLKFIT
jgi:hypothetical protein